MENPLSEQAATSAEDAMLVNEAKGGSRDALERLIERHQSWIFNVVLRMLYEGARPGSIPMAALRRE